MIAISEGPVGNLTRVPDKVGVRSCSVAKNARRKGWPSVV